MGVTCKQFVNVNEKSMLSNIDFSLKSFFYKDEGISKAGIGYKKCGETTTWVLLASAGGGTTFTPEAPLTDAEMPTADAPVLEPQPEAQSPVQEETPVESTLAEEDDAETHSAIGDWLQRFPA